MVIMVMDQALISSVLLATLGCFAAGAVASVAAASRPSASRVLGNGFALLGACGQPLPPSSPDFQEVVWIALANGLVIDRLQGTGRLTTRTAREMQVVGIAARASGIDADARRDHPFAAYADLSPEVIVFEEGDVWTRLMVRVEEVRVAAHLALRAAEQMPQGKLAEEIGALPAGGSAFGLVEGWRGPIWHWVSAGGDNRLSRVKVKDPSFANWPAINYAILKNIVPDFPLVTKASTCPTPATTCRQVTPSSCPRRPELVALTSHPNPLSNSAREG